jgi:hypothetical protein
MTQVVDCLVCKHKVLTNPTTAKKRNFFLSISFMASIFYSSSRRKRYKNKIAK